MKSVYALALLLLALLSGCVIPHRTPPASQERRAGEEMTVELAPNVPLTLCWIPAGTYTRGSPTSEAYHRADETQHQVTISRGFWMGKYEVTQAQWEAVMENNPSYFKVAGKNAPVEAMYWDDCQTFIRKINARVPGGGFRLPTEAEWEYACRAGTTTAFHYGNDLDATMANCNNNWQDKNAKGKQRGTTTTVGSFKPNAWGLYDMHGNVREWCQDWYGDYPTENVTDPTGPNSGPGRVDRGGSWANDAQIGRSAKRTWYPPHSHVFFLGLRLAKTHASTNDALSRQ